jgi:hypothetical protein
MTPVQHHSPTLAEAQDPAVDKAFRVVVCGWQLDDLAVAEV